MMNWIRTRRFNVNGHLLDIHKYSTRAFFHNKAWTEVENGIRVADARGLVTDINGRVVVRPFEKVYNEWDVTPVNESPERIIVEQKVNGFLGVYTHDREVGKIYSTTGSLDSEYTAIVKHHLEPLSDIFDRYANRKNITFMFEIVDRALDKLEHPIKDKEGVYYLGCKTAGFDFTDGTAPRDQRRKAVAELKEKVFIPDCALIQLIDGEYKLVVGEGVLTEELPKGMTNILQVLDYLKNIEGTEGFMVTVRDGGFNTPSGHMEQIKVKTNDYLQKKKILRSKK